MKDLILIEYSTSQRAFHKQGLSEAIERNLKNIIQGKNTDYIPIGISESDDQADEFIKKVDKIIEKIDI